MELRVSSRRPRMSRESYPDDKEISDDDDDRNPKHRRRDDARSRLLDNEVTEHVYTRSYRRGSKPFQNGHLCIETGSQSNETWKKYSFNPLNKEISMKYNQKGPGLTQFSRGLAMVSNSQGQPWSPFGLVPRVSNGGLDVLHPIGLQGTYRPVINSSSNIGLARQRCRDFEEQGFCLRGDSCPMEHGMNRIVVEDVQSLSQFNLPISITSANLSIAPVGTGPTHATSVVTNTLSKNKDPHGNNINHGNGDIDSSADFYDPDQPLWSNDSHTSTGLQSLSHPNVGKHEILLDHRLSGDHHVQGKITRKNVIFKISPSNFLQNGTISNDTGRMNRKSLQKAQRTLFVNGIPHQNNKKKLLLSHFKKFGKVTDISIPLNSERAFVQFSKREEAEAALMAPDAVMSNRFIRLFWANRDIIHDTQTVSAHELKVSSVANNVLGGKKVNSPLQKKLESLELLKEELRKKQEMLDQKRNDFKRKLDKLEKQATGPKGEVASEQHSIKAAIPSGGDRDAIVPSVQVEVAGTSRKFVGPSAKQSSKTNLALVLPESSSLKSSSLSLVNIGSPVGNNRFKLDNRPTAFKVVPPLPDGLADVFILTEHFSAYGDLSKVHVDDVDPKISKVTARIYFRTRHAAEKAFLGCKFWKGHKLQFVWLNFTNFRKVDVARQTHKDSPKITSQQPCISGNEDSEKTKGTAVVEDDVEPYETHHTNCISVAL